MFTVLTFFSPICATISCHLDKCRESFVIVIDHTKPTRYQNPTGIELVGTFLLFAQTAQSRCLSFPIGKSEEEGKVGKDQLRTQERDVHCLTRPDGVRSGVCWNLSCNVTPSSS
jgi:hypothetical protein